MGSRRAVGCARTGDLLYTLMLTVACLLASGLLPCLSIMLTQQCAILPDAEIQLDIWMDTCLRLLWCLHDVSNPQLLTCPWIHERVHPHLWLWVEATPFCAQAACQAHGVHSEMSDLGQLNLIFPLTTALQVFYLHRAHKADQRHCILHSVAALVPGYRGCT